MARCEENRIASRRIARRPGPGVIVRGLTARNTGRSRCVKRCRERERESRPSDRARALSRPFSKDPVRAGSPWVGLMPLSDLKRESRRQCRCSRPLYGPSRAAQELAVSRYARSFSLFLPPFVYCHLPFIPYKPAIPNTPPLSRTNAYRV